MTVLVAYLDESYTQDRYYMAAYVIDLADLHLLEAAHARIMAYAATFGIAPTTELHAHRIMVGRDGWDPVRGKFRAATGIFRFALQELAALPARMFVRGVDVTRLNARYKYPFPPHQIALQLVLEEVDRYAAGTGHSVRVLADEVPDQDAHRAKVDSYRRVTTGGYKPSRLHALDLPIGFASSRTSAGLQAADLIAYLYRRHDSHTETDPRTARVVESMWMELRPIWGAVLVWVP